VKKATRTRIKSISQENCVGNHDAVSSSSDHKEIEYTPLPKRKKKRHEQSSTETVVDKELVQEENVKVLVPNSSPEASSNEKKSSRNTSPTTPAVKMRDLRKEKERKAAKTLAIITGVFIICWLPFFVLAFLTAVVLDPHSVSSTLTSLFLWLGYVNSLLNPVIYTIFSPDFRNTFKRMLPCSNKRITHVSHHIKNGKGFA